MSLGSELPPPSRTIEKFKVNRNFCIWRRPTRKGCGDELVNQQSHLEVNASGMSWRSIADLIDFRNDQENTGNLCCNTQSLL